MSIKKIILTISVVLAFAFIIFILAVVPAIERVVAEEVVLGAHRGAHSIPPENYKENTLEAFQKALNDSSYKFIEFDIQYTKDKQLIVHHDKSLLRLQNKALWLEDLTYEELLKVSDYHIPTYEETMNLVAGKKPLNIEIKSQGNLEDDKKIADQIVMDCRKRGILDSTLISSISSDLIIYVKEMSPDVKTGKIYYITESTFFGTYSSISELYDELSMTKADFLMLHGCNLRNYDRLKTRLPEDKTLVVWYFTDEMYLVQPKTESWVFKIKSFREAADKTIGSQGLSSEEPVKSYISNKKTGCGWWCS
ncbi:MAG: glycerophosphodiester phosphodiesterase [Nanoarchaeota archaeon]|nr:glycerophosphodiester phosphodiesterase [Nanoarchaeota archaeon]MBU0976787.1 glycerophosphodiester phosphodiesterase [Nanoarchaeota archaeon]